MIGRSVACQLEGSKANYEEAALVPGRALLASQA